MDDIDDIDEDTVLQEGDIIIKLNICSDKESMIYQDIVSDLLACQD
jgi:hypothetical protein